MDAQELKQTADSLAAVIAEVEDGDLEATKQGPAFLAGAEQALRAAAAE